MGSPRGQSREGAVVPKTTKSGDARQDEIPSTLQRSDEKAQRTFAKAHDVAADEYGDEQRANRVAFAALKHTHEKVGDHWEPKDHKGPSDPQASEGADQARRGDQETAGGVDANASKQHLVEVAKKVGIPGRSRMSKEELVEAIQKANDRATAKARQKDKK